MKRIFLLVVVMCCSLTLAAQITAFRGKVADGYNFWLYQPQTKYADSTTHDDLKPLILFLHGSSLCGTDMNKVRRYGTLNAVEKGMSIDAYILAPQNPGGAWKPDRVLNIVDWAQANYSIDTNRLYVVGMSLGGYGTMDFAGTYPERVAAAVALCGGSTLKNFDGLSKVPLWVIHGTADQAVSVKESRRVVQAMKAENLPTMLRYEEMEGASHGALARVFYLRELYDWLFMHNLIELEPQGNADDVIISSSTLKTAYRSIDKNAPKPSIIDRQPSSSPPATTGKVHVIKSGDTLGAIARRYGTTVSKLCSANNITTTTTLRIGQKLSL